jgi:hypothetical protein
MAAALGGEQWWGSFRGRGRGEAARVGGGAFKEEGEEARRGGTAARCGRRPARGKGGGGLR